MGPLGVRAPVGSAFLGRGIWGEKEFQGVTGQASGTAGIGAGLAEEHSWVPSPQWQS